MNGVPRKFLTQKSRRALAALLAAPLLAAICACQAAPPPQTVTLNGVLVMKGSAPHGVPVLQTGEGNWELLGADASQMSQLQRQRVVVTGRPLASEPPQRPRLQVEKIEPLAAPAATPGTAPD